MNDLEEDDRLLKYSLKKLNYRYIETEGYQSNRSNQKVVAKWSDNTLYSDVKRRIHEKLKTEATTQDLIYNFPINHQFHYSRKPKSKITVSTLQIAIDPLLRKVIEDPLHVDRKILHKPQQKIDLGSSQPKRITRNMSVNIVRQINQSNSFMRMEKVQTCRKNTKSKAIFTTTSQSFKPNKITQVQNVQLIQKRPPNTFNKLQKSKSQMTRIYPLKNSLNTQNGENNPLLFYFKTKNNVKHSDRQMSIKKIRIKSKNNKVFI